MSKQRKWGQIGEYWLTRDPKSDNIYRAWYDRRARQTRRASLGTSDEDEALIRLVEFVALQGKRSNQDPGTISFEGVLARYYHNHAINLPSGQTAKIAIEKWANYFPDTYVSDITIERQEAFLTFLHKQGLSDGYIARIFTVASAAMNRALQRKELASGPAILTPDGGEARDRVLTPDETAALFQNVKAPHMLMFLMIAYNTLGRPESILELKRFQVKLELSRIEFNPPGRKQTRKYRPVVPISRSLYPWLEDLTTSNVISYGNNDRQVKSIKTAWRELVDTAGIGREVVPKTIRHTMATELRKRGVPPWEVSGMLGHRSAYRTTEIYAKYDPDYLGKAVTAIDEYFDELESKLKGPLVERKLEVVG